MLCIACSTVWPRYYSHTADQTNTTSDPAVNFGHSVRHCSCCFMMWCLCIMSKKGCVYFHAKQWKKDNKRARMPLGDTATHLRPSSDNHGPRASFLGRPCFLWVLIAGLCRRQGGTSKWHLSARSWNILPSSNVFAAAATSAVANVTKA